jgi:hypothetical protein
MEFPLAMPFTLRSCLTIMWNGSLRSTADSIECPEYDESIYEVGLLALVVSYPQHGQECFLRNVHASHALHALLTFFLLLQQLALS